LKNSVIGSVLSEDSRQWRDIAFCLSLLPFKSERSVKKLIEGLQFYRDKLHEETVFTRFTEILAKVRQPVHFSVHR
jgi:condensin complex subunit 1